MTERTRYHSRATCQAAVEELDRMVVLALSPNVHAMPEFYKKAAKLAIDISHSGPATTLGPDLEDQLKAVAKAFKAEDHERLAECWPELSATLDKLRAHRP